MKILGIVLAALFLAYDQFVRWQMRRPTGTYYNAVIARVLGWLAMQSITLWRRYYVRVYGAALSPIGERHEGFHRDEQFAKSPRLYPFAYITEILRWFLVGLAKFRQFRAAMTFSYSQNIYEEKARYASGQALRSTGKQRERVDAWVKLYRAKHPVPSP